MLYRNRFRSFAKTKTFNSIFISILFVLTFLLILFNKSDYILVNKVKNFSIDVVSPLTKILSSPVTATSNILFKINELRFLKEQNIKLKEEIIRLKKWQILATKNQSENSAYKKLLNSTTNEINIVKTAAVIGQSPSIYSKMITINAGKNHGIFEGLTVINERGLVGKIISNTNNNAKVMLITDENFSVSIKNISGDFFAIIKGKSNGNYLISSFIKDDKKPKVGELIMTSGSTQSFPENILVGKIVEVNDNSFLVLPFVDLTNLNFVQAVNVK